MSFLNKFRWKYFALVRIPISAILSIHFCRRQSFYLLKKSRLTLYFRVFCDRNAVDIIICANLLVVYNIFFLSSEYSLHTFGRLHRNDVFAGCTADLGPFQNIDMSDRNIFIADISERVAGWLPVPIVIRRAAIFWYLSYIFLRIDGIPAPKWGPRYAPPRYRRSCGN